MLAADRGGNDERRRRPFLLIAAFALHDFYRFGGMLSVLCRWRLAGETGRNRPILGTSRV